MFVLMIILGIIMTYLVIGQISVVAMAPAIAHKHMNTVGVEVECRDTYNSNRLVWKELRNSDGYRFKSTGNVRGGEDGYVRSDDFRKEMNMMRFLWFIFLPGTFFAASNTKLLERHDPSTIKRKQDEADKRQKAIEKKTEELQAREDAVREAEAKLFDKKLEEALK